MLKTTHSGNTVRHARSSFAGRRLTILVAQPLVSSYALAKNWQDLVGEEGGGGGSVGSVGLLLFCIGIGAVGVLIARYGGGMKWKDDEMATLSAYAAATMFLSVPLLILVEAIKEPKYSAVIGAFIAAVVIGKLFPKK